MIWTKEVFQLVEKILETKGEIVDKLHIIDISEDEEQIYKLYHAKGHCLVVRREVFDADMASEFGTDSTVNEDGQIVYYGYSDDAYEGFERLPIGKCIELLKTYL